MQFRRATLVSDAELRQRLAAILAADAVGYSRLMSIDERATVSALDSARNIFRTHVESNTGTGTTFDLYLPARAS